MEIVDNCAVSQSGAGAGLGLFAKEPFPGRVKTRLCPPLSPTEAAALYAACLQETVATLNGGPFALTLFFSGREDFFRTNFPELKRVPQTEGDLGRRLEQALAGLFAQGHETAALIGSDSPDLPLARVEAALAALNRVDCVTIPAADGGYVLIGTRRNRPELFRNMPWSTPRLLAATRQRAVSLGLSYHELSPWEDIDDLPSLQRLLQRSPHCATARFARSRIARHIQPDEP
ncbi:MAG: TIGR04282 family arsenosugar biosynthesis glycosyltransferase [Desulfuromonadaceae bacterium]